MIEVKDLVKKYGDRVAVDHLTFTVEKGQILGFLGPNGAGKSTTMNMLTGYISATEGSIRINGHDIYEEPEEAKKSIGYLPEQPPVYLDMTVREYLKFVMDIKKVPKAKRAEMMADIVKRTQIADVQDRLIKHLSKGYRQRVGLAQAIAGYPEVIILDEPTVGLDPMQIIEIRDLIKALAQKHTVIISSHILSEISAVCDTVMIINKGKMVVTDRVENLPKHLAGAASLTLQVKGERERVRQVLQAMEKVEKVEIGKGSGDGLVRVDLHTADGQDVREDIFYALAQARCPIFEMSSGSMSLEEIFLEVTRGDAMITEEGKTPPQEQDAVSREQKDLPQGQESDRGDDPQEEKTEEKEG